MTRPTLKVALIGAALSANKGAAAMVETVIARQPSVSGPCAFALLTTYPAADAPLVPAGAPVRVVGLEPLRLALVEFPLALVARAARVLRLPLGWVRARACRAILDADVVVDVAGISFSDGRGVPITVYNALMTGLPLLLGTPTVKAAQAIGPVTRPLNRSLARAVLPHLAAVCARGAQTGVHLDALGLRNVVDVADLAFSLDEAPHLPPAVDALVTSLDEYVVVMPSSVVRRLFEATGGNYVAAAADLIRSIRATTGRAVVIAPHSFRAGKGEDRMNDGPVCREIASLLSDDSGVHHVDAELTAGELRTLVARSRVLVTSRFHAMISGLSTCTPTIVLGWSHKYREVLDDFGLVEFGTDVSALAAPQRVVDLVVRCLADRDSLAEQIARALPAVTAKSARNFTVIDAAARR
ncbi:MAG: polysaccharide pyruvyl transferase family protein [Ilumatobacteraceae bacterium]